MDHTNVIPVFFAADVNYYQHLCVLMASILENNPEERFAFHVMTDRDDAEAEKIRRIVDTHPHSDLRFIVMNDALFEKLPLPWEHITLQMYYRLLIPMLAAEWNKVLYFDSDMVCHTALRELWATPLDDYLDHYYIAGVPDNLCTKESYLKPLGLSCRGNYVNSGVLLMNLQAIREDDKIAEALAWLDAHPETQYPDQDAINAVCAERIRLLDLKWNIQLGSECKTRAGIHHFTSGKKPWKTDVYCRHPGRSLYFQYLKSTPYRNYAEFYAQNSLKAQIAGRIKAVLKWPERLVRNYIVRYFKKVA